MPTKRQPLHRDARARLTPEIVALFRRLELTPKRLRSSAEYIAGEKQLCRALGVDFWTMKTPLNVLSAESCYPRDHLQTRYWDEAWAWRQALLEAAGLQGNRRAAHQVRQ